MRFPPSPFDAFDCVWAEITSAEKPWGAARTHAEGVMWPVPERTWPLTGGTSGSSIASAEDKKSVKRVRSHAIPSIPFRFFRMRLGGDPLGGAGLGSPRE